MGTGAKPGPTPAAIALGLPAGEVVVRLDDAKVFEATYDAPLLAPMPDWTIAEITARLEHRGAPAYDIRFRLGDADDEGTYACTVPESAIEGVA